MIFIFPDLFLIFDFFIVLDEMELIAPQATKKQTKQRTGWALLIAFLLNLLKSCQEQNSIEFTYK